MSDAVREAAIDAVMDSRFGDYWRKWNVDSERLATNRFVVGREVDAVVAVYKCGSADT